MIHKTLQFGDPSRLNDFASKGFYVGVLRWKASLNASSNFCSSLEASWNTVSNGVKCSTSPWIPKFWKCLGPGGLSFVRLGLSWSSSGASAVGSSVPVALNALRGVRERPSAGPINSTGLCTTSYSKAASFSSQRVVSASGCLKLWSHCRARSSEIIVNFWRNN